jgi:hypothetical protein
MSRQETLSGSPESAIDRITEAKQYDPFGKYSWSLVPAYYAMRLYDDAKLIMGAIQNPPAMMLIWMAVVYVQAGDTREAREMAEKFIAIASDKLSQAGTAFPESWLDFVSERWPFKHSVDREHFLEGLRKAGVPE